MTSKQAIEISDQIQRAKNRSYKAIERAGTGITDPQEIDRIISEVIEALERELFRHRLQWVLQDYVRADASRVTSTFTFTLIDAARRGAILGKVRNHFNRSTLNVARAGTRSRFTLRTHNEWPGKIDRLG